MLLLNRPKAEVWFFNQHDIYKLQEHVKWNWSLLGLKNGHSRRKGNWQNSGQPVKVITAGSEDPSLNSLLMKILQSISHLRKGREEEKIHWKMWQLRTVFWHFRLTFVRQSLLLAANCQLLKIFKAQEWSYWTSDFLYLTWEESKTSVFGWYIYPVMPPDCWQRSQRGMLVFLNLDVHVLLYKCWIKHLQRELDKVVKSLWQRCGLEPHDLDLSQTWARL